MAITKERFYVRTDVCLAETGAPRHARPRLRLRLTEVPGRERFHALGRDRGVVHRHFCGGFRRGPWLAPLVLESREQLQERISTAAGSRVENQQEDRFATTRDVLIVLGGARARAEHDVLPRRPKNDCGCVAQQPTLFIPRLEPVRARSNVDLP
jgi:hypothetical protein